MIILQCDLVRISHFECEQQEECFDTVIASIDKVTKEQIVGFGTVTPDFEQFHKVVELAVNIPTNLTLIQYPFLP